MNIFKKSLISLSAITVIALTGCGNSGGSGISTVTGILADGAIGNAKYECGSTTGFTNRAGEFTCPVGSSVDFYYGNIKLGGVSTLPSDKIVLIQDVLNVNRTDVNDTVVTRLAVFLQSMDDDADHSNGIFLDQNDIASITSSVNFSTFNDAKVTALVTAASKIEVTKEQARINLQAVTDNVKDFSNIDGDTTDTTAPDAPTLTSTPDLTNQNSVSVELIGEVGAKIFLNGVDTQNVITSNGKFTVTLDTNGTDGLKAFSYTLQDSSGNESTVLSIKITKDATSPSTPTLTSTTTTTSNSSVTAVVNGDVGSKIFINGTDTQLTIAADGTKQVTLDTSGADGVKTFNITVKDTATNESTSVVLNVTKVPVCATLSGVYYNGALVSVANPINLAKRSELTFEFSSTMETAGLSVTPTIATWNRGIKNIVKSADTNITLDYAVPKSLASGSVADYSATDTLIITQGSCTFSTDINLFNTYVAPLSNGELETLINAYIATPGGSDAGGTYVSQIINANTQNVTSMEELLDDETFNLDISAWDVSQVTNMDSVFFDSNNWDHTFNQDISLWETSNVTNMTNMFKYSKAFNQDIGDWNTSKVTNMYGMFNNADAFNQDIGDWNTSEVTNMESMFESIDLFNQALNTWDVSKVTNMDSMFDGALVFNQDLNSWNTSEVLDMEEMFEDAPVFNGNISSWNTANVTSMDSMFEGAKLFNQDIGSWNVSLVTDAENMFDDAWAFNQNINSWNLHANCDFSGMFTTAKAFNQPLNSWDVSSTTDFSSIFKNTEAFNQDLNSWDISSATEIYNMFQGATAFNGNIVAWSLPATITALDNMFYNATSFNQNISGWDVSNINSVAAMLAGATSFNQDLSPWNTKVGVSHMAFDTNTISVGVITWN